MIEMMTDEFNPARLTLARRRRGWTKQALARRGAIAVRSLTNYEAGQVVPGPHVVERLAVALEFPTSFFYRSDAAEVSADAVSFRSFARLSAAHRSAALAAASIAVELSAAVDEFLELPTPDLPDVWGLDAATAALAIRSEWAMGNLPLPNAVQLLEAKGVRVFSLVDDVAALDAFAVWDRGASCIFLTQHKSAERSRWDICHELAHLLLHTGIGPQGRAAEEEADAFAAEFLMPSAGVLARAARNPSLIEVRSEKRYWRVSALAYIRKLRRLEIVSEYQYTSLVIEASKAGYRSQENEIERDTSGLWPKVFEILAAEGVSLAAFAERIGVRPNEVRELTFSTLNSIEGDTRAEGGAGRAPGRTNHLRIVGSS